MSYSFKDSSHLLLQVSELLQYHLLAAATRAKPYCASANNSWSPSGIDASILLKAASALQVITAVEDKDCHIHKDRHKSCAVY